MKYTVEKIDGCFVILEDENGNRDVWVLNRFPDDVREGDLVQKEDNRFIVLTNETEKRKEEIQSLFDRLREG